MYLLLASCVFMINQEQNPVIGKCKVDYQPKTHNQRAHSALKAPHSLRSDFLFMQFKKQEPEVKWDDQYHSHI